MFKEENLVRLSALEAESIESGMSAHEIVTSGGRGVLYMQGLAYCR